jgi:predicted TIM-barrel fold metal-dependent hydrolase
MVFDGHIHITPGEVQKERFIKQLNTAGIDGGLLISLSPLSFNFNDRAYSTEERMDNLFAWKGDHSLLYPFFWIDPMEADALDQVQLAEEREVAGYKVICNHFYPGDPQALKVYAEIAKKGKPILFHSGILWDGLVSSKYNRPGEFESLLEIDGLRFSLAHVSWPWHDECIAVYGKFLNAYSARPDLSVEMFIDITPGTPPIYREEVLTKLFTVGYDIENNVLFGTDCSTGDYNHKWACEWMERDNKIYSKLGLDVSATDKIYSKNLERFLGTSKEKIEKNHLRSGE